MRAALAIQDVICTYGEELRSGYGVELAVRVTLNTGPVVLTDDDEGPDRYNALGDTANVAARLQELAPDGGIVVGPETERQIAAVRRARVARRGGDPRDRAPVARRPRHGRARPGPGARDRAAGRPQRASSRCSTRPARRSPTAAARSSRSPASRASASRASWSRRAGATATASASSRAARARMPRASRTGPCAISCATGSASASDAPEARVRLELKAALGGLGEGAESAYPFLARLLALPLEAEADGGPARAQPRGRPAADVRGHGRRRAPPRRGAPALHRDRRPAVGGLPDDRAARGPAGADRPGAARAWC